jgi:uncharacterized protein (DUF433 family)
VAGTGVTVRRIAQWQKLGLTPQEIAGAFGHLSLAQVHAALAYYHANQSQIDTDLEAEELKAAEIESLHAGETSR